MFPMDHSQSCDFVVVYAAVMADCQPIGTALSATEHLLSAVVEEGRVAPGLAIFNTC